VEQGIIAFIESEALGLGTIDPATPPGPVSFSIAVVDGSWQQLFPGRPVEFERQAGTTIAIRVRPA
jgi:hypothetical protein